MIRTTEQINYLYEIVDRLWLDEIMQKLEAGKKRNGHGFTQRYDLRAE